LIVFLIIYPFFPIIVLGTNFIPLAPPAAVKKSILEKLEEHCKKELEERQEKKKKQQEEEDKKKKEKDEEDKKKKEKEAKEKGESAGAEGRDGEAMEVRIQDPGKNSNKKKC